MPQIAISSTAANPLIFNTTTGAISGGTLSGGQPAVNTTTPGITQIKNHQLSWWFDGEPLKAVLKDSATFGMGLWDH